MNDTSNSGIYVFEGPSRGQAIPTHRESVAAFLAPTPRGPINRPVEVHSMEDFLRNFSTPGFHCRLEFILRQYFANGGERAYVVRVSGDRTRKHIDLPGRAGPLLLQAQNPGRLECIRASVDYDGIPASDIHRFNLTVQRLRSTETPLVDEQEIYLNISTDPDEEDFIGYALEQSLLVRLHGVVPELRPEPSLDAMVAGGVCYVDGVSDGQIGGMPSDYDLIGSESEGTGLIA
ncbi:MAG: hypothetical protein ACR2P6_09695, partial [Gammaproteobacteria bacterium]